MSFLKGKKVLVLVLTIILTLSMAGSAFANWPSFQNTNTNNGVITDTEPYPINNPPQEYPVSLPTNGVLGTEVYSGIDAGTVFGEQYAYTLYNGGFTPATSTSGGARLATTNYRNHDPNANNILIDADANNVQQLSTPFYNLNTDILYAATTYYTDLLLAQNMPGTTGNTVPAAVGSAPGTLTVNFSNVVVPSDYWQPQLATGFVANVSGLSGNVVMTLAGSSPPTTITFGSQSYTYGYGAWTLYNNSGDMVPAGTYNIAVTFTNTSATPVPLPLLQFLTSNWHLYAVTSLETGSENVYLLTGGYGQANTPISYSNDGSYIYFGIYEGDRCYYQASSTTNTASPITLSSLTPYTPAGGDDFYWAGAADVTVGITECVVFGSDAGTIYVRPVGATFGNAVGNTVPLVVSDDAPGKIRSSIVSASVGTPATAYVFFTSEGTGNNAFVWKMTVSSLLSTPAITFYTPVNNSQASVSTPVISENEILYVGTTNYIYVPNFAEIGTVQAFDPVALSHIADIYGGDSGSATDDPVQSSPIVWSDTTTDAETDYIFFTINAKQGAAYCYQFEINSSDAVDLWVTNGTTSDPVFDGGLQGFSAYEGYLIYGDDSNTLYVYGPPLPN